MDKRIIFACDYEGTYHLKTGHPEVSEVEAVKRFRRAGNLFGIVFEGDAFEVMARIGEYEDEWDFIVCSTGACLVSRLPVGDLNGAPTRLYFDDMNQYFLMELHDLFESVGADSMNADISGFMGGPDEARRFRDEYDPARGLGCWAHYWGGGGVYFHNIVNRDALPFVTPFSQCRATFKNSITAEGVAGEVNRRYRGRLRAYTRDTDVIVLPADSNKARGVARFVEFVGASAHDVWAFGDGAEDACMLSAFNGIALAGAHPSAVAAAGCEASSVAEALAIAGESASR